MNWGADVNNGQTEVIQRIQQILSSLPTGIKQPFVLRFDLSNIPVCLVTASGGGLDEKQLYDLANNSIEPQLERLGGVASASVDGGKVRQITVNLTRDQLFAKGLSVLDVVRAVNDSNFLLPAGDIKVGRLDYNIYTNNQFRLVRPMEDIVVRKTGAGGVPIHVKDLGYVVDSHETQTAIVRIDGTRGVFMRVNKQPGANTVAVVDQVRALIPQVIGVPPGVNVGITFDQSTYIRQAIESLWHEALQGSALAFLLAPRPPPPPPAGNVPHPEEPMPPAPRSPPHRLFRFPRLFFGRPGGVSQGVFVWALAPRRIVVGGIAATFVASLFLVLAP